MSLATLKRKTNNSNPRNCPISGKGTLGFALNGTRRVVGTVGHTNLGKRETRTPFRGTVPMGHGGKLGKYQEIISYNNELCCSNDTNIIKTSSKYNKGMIETRYMGTLHGAYKEPYYDNNGNLVKPLINWVQPIDNGYNQHHTQGQYIKDVHANNDCVTNFEAYLENGPYKNAIYNCNGNIACSWHIGGKKYITGHGVGSSSGGQYAKTLHGKGAISQSDYISGHYLKQKNNLPTPKNKAHFPMNLIRNGCDENMLTVKEAIEKGLLPEDHVNELCSSKLTIILYSNGTQKQVLLSKNVDTYNPIFNNAKKIKFGNGTETIVSSYDTNNTTIPPTNLLNLIEVIIPNSVKEIGQLAFYYTKLLTSIIIPNSVTTIGLGAFAKSSLNSINLPSVTYIGESAFFNCTGLKSVNLPLVTTIGDYAFHCCSALVTIDLPLVTSIGDCAFDCCSALNSIKLTRDLSLQIGNQAFNNIGSKAKVYLTSRANKAFGNSMYFKTVDGTHVIYNTS